MKRKTWFAALAVLALTAGFVAVLSVQAQAKPPVDCSIVLCQAPPPSCPPGFKLGIPPGQCCPRCLPSK